MDFLNLDAVTDFRILLVVGVSLYLFFSSSSWKLRHIPTAGFSGWPFVSYISLIQFFFHGDDLLRECHERYKGKPFKIAHLTGWIVILNNGSENVKEAFKWSDSLAHPNPATSEAFRVELTIGKIALKDRYIVALIDKLTQNLNDDFLCDLRDEFASALEDTLQATNGWKAYKLEEMSFGIISPLVARIIAGNDLSKNQEFLNACRMFPKKIFETAILANAFFPSFLKPLAPLILSGTTKHVNTVLALTTPIVESSHLWRLSSSTLQVNKRDTPLDWLIEMAESDEEEYSLESIARRILHLSFTSHHTTSTTFLRVLYNLCDHQECIAPLREEAQKAISDDGWSKTALDRMKMHESVIQETLRMMPISNLQPVRTILKDHTLDDGTFLPAGTGIGFRTDSTHFDSSVYQNPEQFDGFRFYNMNKNIQGIKNNITTPTRTSIVFGFGKHVCPGRFIAATELKLFISYFLLNYDIKAGKRIKSFRPKLEVITSNPYVPNNPGEILVKKRITHAGTSVIC